MTDSLFDIKYIDRIIIGNNDPTKMKTDNEINNDLIKLNDALKKGGKIIAQDKSFTIYQIGEHQVVLQYVSYHIGYKKKPFN